MQHYDYTVRLHELWNAAKLRYESGDRSVDDYFTRPELNDLASIGLNAMDVYDYVEDFCTRGEPDFGTFLTLHSVRRDYFINIQKTVLSDHLLNPDDLPSKEDSLEGIVWLPRIIPKAIAKLKGELPADIMYGCGGDRRFFKANNVHPADFLKAVWFYGSDQTSLILWLKARREKLAQKA
jgi:hypothetical protein